MRHTKTDKILLWFHIVDLLLLGVIVYALNLPTRKCDAFIMAEYYKGENGWWMRNIADRYRRMLPDSTRLVVEFENGSVPQSNALSEQDMEKLKSELEDCGCIGKLTATPAQTIPLCNFAALEWGCIHSGCMTVPLPVSGKTA